MKSPNGASAREVAFCARVPSQHRSVVERLFYFNQRQGVHLEGIRATIEAEGTPYIVERDGSVWLEISKEDSQCLFAVTPDAQSGVPIGVVLYRRPAIDTLRISHIATNPQRQPGASSATPDIGGLLFTEVRRIARHLRGVTRIELPYRQGLFIRI